MNYGDVVFHVMVNGCSILCCGSFHPKSFWTAMLCTEIICVVWCDVISSARTSHDPRCLDTAFKWKMSFLLHKCLLVKKKIKFYGRFLLFLKKKLYIYHKLFPENIYLGKKKNQTKKPNNQKTKTFSFLILSHWNKAAKLNAFLSQSGKYQRWKGFIPT